ncbi:MAG: thioether cross-link-forming SCIFF peptide maturase [Defluviitaleaceae bacterium]|nr:thioether cross-link-forming SCIFF peptide maturase [Defluviitaleaceae bacterium]
MIHCFSVNSLNLVLDVNSGALHQIDDVAFDVLINMKKASDIDGMPFSGARDEIKGLIDAGQLFSERVDDVHEYMQNRKPIVKALCLHIAHECNLRCTYCFAGKGHYTDSDRGLMSLEVGKKALDFLIRESGARHNLEVDFFGGEPMLNFGMVKDLVIYGREREKEAGKRFRFTLTTNATLLRDEHHTFINENFDNVVLSLDGRKHVNDIIRLKHGGGGSYDTIFPKIKALVEARGHERYYVRGTYTRHNLDFSADVLHLADAGFKNISVEPVVAASDEKYSIREIDLPMLFDEYERLARELLDRDARFFHFEMDITGGPCIAKRVTGCGAGSEYLAVTPSGKLYPCHQFVGDEKFRIGDLDVGIVNNKQTENFSTCHVLSKPECQNCWARYYCSGGCMATAHYMNGSIQKPDTISCSLMKKRVECALYMFSMRQMR